MKKMIFGIISILLLVSVIAQADTSSDSETDVESEDVGIAPDSAFYGLENAFKKISLALTFSKEAKARKELDIARERLREVRLMIDENKLDAAEKAKIKHEEISQKLKARFENKVEADDDEIELQAEIENEIEEQEAEIEDIKTRIEIRGELSEEQRAKLMELVESLKSSGNDVRLKIDSRKDRLKISLKEKGLTEIEIEERIKSEKETGSENALTNRIEHVKREIEKSREHLDQNKNNLDNDKLVELRVQLDTADETVSEAGKKVEEKKYDEARELINKALRLAVLVRGNEKRFEANREILKDELKREVGEERLERAMEKLREKEDRLEIKREKLEARNEARKIAEDSEDEDDDLEGIEEIDEDEFEDETEEGTRNKEVIF